MDKQKFLNWLIAEIDEVGYKIYREERTTGNIDKIHDLYTKDLVLSEILDKVNLGEFNEL
jgi:hypothetical protein